MFDEANKFSAECMKKDSLCRNPKILHWRGKMLVYMGNEVSGKKHFVQALSYDPDLKECQVSMKNIKKAQALKDEAAEVFKTKDFKLAKEAHERCLDFDPLNAHFNATMMLNISICQDKLGDKREALYSLNKSIKFNSKYAKAFVKRGDMHLALEEFTEAIRDYSEASDYDSSGFNV